MSETKRPRNAAATREAILVSAHQAFVQSGYDGAGLREIAAGAGVTAMLVKRYFGSKEGLFAAVVERAMASTTLLTPAILGAERPGHAMAAALVGITRAEDTPLDGFQILLRSAGSARAAEIGRAEIERGYQASLAAALQGGQEPLRAALLLALVAGVQLMRQGMALPALAEADPRALTDLLGGLFEELLKP